MDFSYLSSAAGGGRKGEGWIGPIRDGGPGGTPYGWNGYGNAGGGGNCLGAGGGGGGNGGNGGAGGLAFGETMGDAGAGGFGVAVPWTDRLVFGGGGGASHGEDPASGGPGGGIVLIRFARVVLGSNGAYGIISASGDNGYDGGDIDGGEGGGGGAGAGGTVHLDWYPGSTGHAYPDTGNIVHVYGGFGGASTGSGATCYGPGGGGGGGRVRIPDGGMVEPYGGGHGLCGGVDGRLSDVGKIGTVENFAP
jgi:hypothetical protein